MIRDKVKKIYTTLYNALHQNFYTSCEIFTPAALAPLATFSISAHGPQFSHIQAKHEQSSWSPVLPYLGVIKPSFFTTSQAKPSLYMVKFFQAKPSQSYTKRSQAKPSPSLLISKKKPSQAKPSRKAKIILQVGPSQYSKLKKNLYIVIKFHNTINFRDSEKVWF